MHTDLWDQQFHTAPICMLKSDFSPPKAWRTLIPLYIAHTYHILISSISRIFQLNNKMYYDNVEINCLFDKENPQRISSLIRTI